VVRPQVPQYVTLQILAILQPYPPQERAAGDTAGMTVNEQCCGLGAGGNGADLIGQCLIQAVSV